MPLRTAEDIVQGQHIAAHDRRLGNLESRVNPLTAAIQDLQDHTRRLNDLEASVVALAAEGLIDLDMLTQDGVRVRASAGAGFVYPICGDMRTMPGLSASPAVNRIDIDDDGLIMGLS